MISTRSTASLMLMYRYRINLIDTIVLGVPKHKRSNIFS